jgi:hypothetical protein
MTNIKTAFALVATVSLILCGAAFAAEKVYSATGKILHVTTASITLRTSAQDLEVTRDAKTKVSGDLKPGTSVKITYDKVAGQPHAVEVSPITSMPSKGKPY